MKNYPEWVYKVKIPKGLRLVSNEEAKAAISVGAKGYGYHLDHTDGPAYLRSGIKNHLTGGGGETLWDLSIHDFPGGRRFPYMLTFICVDE